MGRVKVTARVFGPRLAARARTLPLEAHKLLETVLADVTQFSQKTFESHAPVQSGRLKRGITVTQTGSGASIRISAKDPKTGFDYVAVTRFGHKVRFIRPVAGRSASGRRQFRSGFLRFPYKGKIFYRKSVRGYHPKKDWVVTPRVETHNYARQRFRIFEKELARRW